MAGKKTKPQPTPEPNDAEVKNAAAQVLPSRASAPPLAPTLAAQPAKSPSIRDLNPDHSTPPMPAVAGGTNAIEDDLEDAEFRVDDIFDPIAPDNIADDWDLDIDQPALGAAGLEASSPDKALSLVDPVTRYLSEVRRYRVLTREEEQKVAEHYYETQDPKAAEILVKANLRFVVRVAGEYAKFGARLIDLIQEGNVGLMHAVREFNPYKGVRLITYAVWWIRGYIQDYLLKQYSIVRMGTTSNQRKLFYQLHKHREELERMGYESGIKQLSGRLDIPEKDVRMMTERMSGRDVSLSQPTSSDGSTTMLDFQSADAVDPVDELATQQGLSLLQTEIDELRPTLNEKELLLLDERLLSDQPLTLQEVGDRFGITREAVRQAEVRLIQKLRSRMLRDQI